MTTKQRTFLRANGEVVCIKVVSRFYRGNPCGYRLAVTIGADTVKWNVLVLTAEDAMVEAHKWFIDNHPE